MEKHKSKIKEILKKMSNTSSFKTFKSSPMETPNPYNCTSPKKTHPSSPLKTSIKLNYKIAQNSDSNKKYALNKTTIGTPQ